MMTLVHAIDTSISIVHQVVAQVVELEQWNEFEKKVRCSNPSY